MVVSDNESEDELDVEVEDDIKMEDIRRQKAQQILKARKRGTGETRKTISLIWRTTPIHIDDTEQADHILRSEWACSRARSCRASEEVQLLVEEMRWVLEYLKWKAGWWDAHLETRTDVGADLAEGLHSYAIDQANLQRSLMASFRLLWKTPLQMVNKVVGSTGGTCGNDEGIEHVEHADNDANNHSDTDNDNDNGNDDDNADNDDYSTL